MIPESSVTNHVCAYPAHYSAGDLGVNKNIIVGYKKIIYIEKGNLMTNYILNYKFYYINVL